MKVIKIRFTVICLTAISITELIATATINHSIGLWWLYGIWKLIEHSYLKD